MSITAAQLKSARELLGWSVVTLAVKSNIGTAAITAVEKGTRAARSTTFDQLKATFESAGVVFGDDVKLGTEAAELASFNIRRRRPIPPQRMAKLRKWK